MLKRNITYENFNGEKCTGTFYFNISKPEIVELQYSDAAGFDEVLKKIVKADDQGGLIAIFKKLILDSYGQKSPDGERFIKNDQLREDFSQMAAYQSLFMELATSDGAAAEFIIGIFPADMSGDLRNSLQAPSPEAIIAKAQQAIADGTTPLPPGFPSGISPAIPNS
jgi:hypothetical protein